MIDLSEYEGLARDTGAFEDIELDILKESFFAWQLRPGDPYTVLEVRDGKILAAFAVVCRETGTEYTFDIRAMCVDPSYVGKGVTASLVGIIEQDILRSQTMAILRFETSRSKEAAIGAGILSENGFAVIGHIPDFYAPGDDYFMYAKHLHHDRARKSGTAGEGAEGREGR